MDGSNHATIEMTMSIIPGAGGQDRKFGTDPAFRSYVANLGCAPEKQNM